MTKNSEYATFSLDSYQKPEDNVVLPDGWQTFRTSDSYGLSTGGYFGIVYINNNVTPKQLVVAHRGTSPDFPDIVNDLILALEQVPLQFTNNAVPFITAIKNELGTALPQYQITFTGHSLGAVLAELSAAKENVKAVTFDSPGSKPIIENMVSDSTLPNSALIQANQNVITL